MSTTGHPARLGFLVGAPKIGGAERQVRALARGAMQQGHEVQVYFLERAGRRPVSSILDFSDVPHAHLGHGRLRGWWSRARLRRRLEADRVECLIAFNVDAMEFAASVVGPGDRPYLVGSVRGLGFVGDAGRIARLRASSERMQLLTCNSVAIEQALLDAGVCPAGHLRSLPNIVELPAMSPVGTTSAPRMLFVGNLVEVKRPALFVQAWRQARRHLPSLGAIVVGDGPLAGALRRAAGDDFGQLEFRGHLAPSEVPYDEVDVVVNTSLREGSSNVLLEAMAHGVPVVASRGGGNEDLVESSGAGLLVDTDEPENFAAAIVRLLEAPDERRRRAEAGRRFIETRHTSKVVVAQLEGLVAEAIGRSGRG